MFTKINDLRNKQEVMLVEFTYLPTLFITVPWKWKKACDTECRKTLIYLVPELGIEPRCPCERGILSPLRLPVSPLRHDQQLYRWGAKSQAKNCWQAINAHVKWAAQFRKSYWGCSSAGRALEWHSRGQRCDPAHLHQDLIQHNPKKYKNPLEIAGFLLLLVQRRVIRFYKIYKVWGLIYI